MIFFPTVIYNILLSLLLTLELIILQSSFTDLGFIEMFKNFDFFIIFILLFAISLFKNDKVKFLTYSILFFLMLIELLHYQYYKHSLLPSEIYAFFYDFKEVMNGISGIPFSMIALPLFAVCIAMILNVFIFRIFSSILYKIPYFSFSLPLALLYMGINAYLNFKPGEPVKQNTHLLNNSIGTLTAFFGSYLPMKWTKFSGGKSYPLPDKIPSTNASVIVLLNESMGSSHMSVFGYSVPTTPSIKALASKKLINIHKCITSGSNTQIALLNFFLYLDTLRQFDQLYQGKHLLFKLAKENQFKTYFISSQSLEGGSSFLGYMNLGYIDYISLPHHRNPNYGTSRAEPDSCLFPLIENFIQKPEKKLIVVQFYGCHEPYQERYPKNFKIFKESDYKHPHTAHYDNAMCYQDYLFNKLYHILIRKTKTPLYVFYFSDHGECAGEEDMFGHNMFRKPVLSIPFIYFSVEVPHDTLSDYFTRQQTMITQKQVNVCIRRLLGYNYAYRHRPYYLTIGMDYMGYDGHVVSKLSADSILFTKNADEFYSQLSNLPPQHPGKN
ncbi:MAG: sulfatase-like hydrolase/transferase [Bacteroidia bacterium]|nr:sulfatase-like hydrolase/transferase [Bacteroidia bacterium]